MQTDVPQHSLGNLEETLGKIAPLSVAVSGGVDSMTLAFVAHRYLADKVSMLHAVSPAVPPEATTRVRRYAEQYGWSLQVMDAGEFSDERYRANPANRCFFCKTNLYATMTGATTSTLVSGTNTDDLGDYRPGLLAARDHGVRHPYVEAGIDKETVRAIARLCDLDDLAELPAAPCLSSRIHTGIEIDPGVLTAVNRVERALREELEPQVARCRVRPGGVEIQLDTETLAGSGLVDEGEGREAWRQRVVDTFASTPRAVSKENVSFTEYQMGSAFIRSVTL